jgi:UDP-N-acetylmuramoyl-tripeptide--D-alanyl-D-alanine ligase
MARHARLVRPDVAVVTAVASEHNRSFGSLEATRHEKAEMVRQLPGRGVAVLNGDDFHVRWMAGATAARTITYGFQPANDVVGSDYRLDWPRGSVITVTIGDLSRELRLRLLGRPAARAAIAAVTVAVGVAGRCIDEVVADLEQEEPMPGRMQPLPLANGAWLIRDDAKSAAETIESALETFADVPARRRVVVLGDISEPMGSQRQVYRRIGGLAARTASEVIIIAGRKAYQAYRAGGRQVLGDAFDPLDAEKMVSQVVRHLSGRLEPGDVVLVKGRDTQRLERIALGLLGRKVGCDLDFCNTRMFRCDQCPMLERGWRLDGR